MKKILHSILSFFLIFSFANVAHAHESNITVIGGNLHDYFSAVVADGDGGYTVFGSYQSTTGELGSQLKGMSDAVIIKYDANNDIVWANNFGGTKKDEFYGGIKSSDGGYVAVGMSVSTDQDMTGLSPNDNYGEAIIVKYDSAGNVIWKNSFGGNNTEAFNHVVETSDGGFVAVGYSGSSDRNMSGLWRGVDDAILVKYTSNGIRQWTRVFGGGSVDRFEHIVATSDGGVVAVGYSSSSDRDMDGLLKGSSYDGILVKYDANGNMVWKKSFGGFSLEYFTSAIGLNDGSIVVVGYGRVYKDVDGRDPDNTKMLQGILAKFDANGNIMWSKYFGGNKDDKFLSVTTTSDNGFIVVGSTNSDTDELSGLSKGGEDGLLVKYDASGNLVWVKTFGGSGGSSAGSYSWEYFQDVTPISNDEFVAVGSFASNDMDVQNLNRGSFGADAIIVKFDHNGSWDYTPNDPSDPDPVDDGDGSGNGDNGSSDESGNGDDDDGDNSQSNGSAPKLQCSGSECNILPGMNKLNKNHYILANKKESVDISILIPRNYATIIALWN